MTPEQFAEQTLRDLNEQFEDDEAYVEALEELIDRAQSSLDAKRIEMEK